MSSSKTTPRPVILHPKLILDGPKTSGEVYRKFLPESEDIDEDLMLKDLMLCINHIRQFSNSLPTMLSYRTEINRYLNWCWLIKKKSVTEIRREDVLDYFEFSEMPPPSWVADSTYLCHVKNSNGDLVFNEKWKPFVRKDSTITAQASINAMFLRLSSLYKTLMTDEAVGQNPVRAIRQKRKFTQKNIKIPDSMVITPEQIDYCISICEEDAHNAESPRDIFLAERSIFTFSIMLGMYLRVSETVSDERHEPTHGCFLKDSDNNWWFKVTGKGNKERIIVTSDVVIESLMRFRDVLSLPPIPSKDEETPLIPSLKGIRFDTDGTILNRSHLKPLKSTSTVWRMIKKVFYKARKKMESEGKTEDAYQLLMASCHYLRHTGITNDVKFRPIEHVRDDAGHESSNTTYQYVQSIHKERAKSKISR